MVLRPGATGRTAGVPRMAPQAAPASIRTIHARLHVGQPRAQQVRACLAALI
jgi:hypothetical protein